MIHLYMITLLTNQFGKKSTEGHFVYGNKRELEQITEKIEA